MSEKEEKSWWAQQGRRFQNGMIVSGLWLIGWLIYAVSAGVYTLKLNEIGDFMAGVAAPVAFGWLVLGYMQQGEELQKTQIEVEKQARFLGRSAFMDFMKLVQADIQFATLRMTEKLRKNLVGPAMRDGIKQSRTAYFVGGDKEAPVRRAILIIIEDMEAVKYAAKRDDQSIKIAKKVITDFRRLLEEADLVDDDQKAMRRFLEQSLYGELFNALCLLVGETPDFKVRNAVSNSKDLAV
jgi:predicted RNA binding protein with dsRBD fold (UPF0201 family)